MATIPGLILVPGRPPDGQRIAYMSAVDHNLEIYVMNADGSGQTAS